VLAPTQAPPPLKSRNACLLARVDDSALKIWLQSGDSG
jgi:hypothetical protein